MDGKGSVGQPDVRGRGTGWDGPVRPESRRVWEKKPQGFGSPRVTSIRARRAMRPRTRRGTARARSQSASRGRIRRRTRRASRARVRAGAVTHQNRASLLVLLRLHRENRAAGRADAGGGHRERRHGLLEAEAGGGGRRDAEGGESVDERHLVRSVWRAAGRRRDFSAIGVYPVPEPAPAPDNFEVSRFRHRNADYPGLGRNRREADA